MPYGNPMMGRNSIAQAIMAQRRMGGNPGAGMPMQQPMQPPMQGAGGLNAQGLPGGPSAAPNMMPGAGGMPGGGMPPMSAPSAMPTGFAAGAGLSPQAGASPMSMMFSQGQPYG